MPRSCFAALIVSLLLISIANAEESVALRFRFGMKDTDGTDWSGKLVLSGGEVKSIRGWRWMPGDHASGDTFTVHTRRQPAQSRAERQRAQRGERMPMQDNGIVAVLSGVNNDTEVTFDALPGKAAFKLGDLPFGKRLRLLDDNLTVERCPAPQALAESLEDEDYPSAAVAKDGTIYVAYLSFKRGEDFQGVRERPATPESGPVTGPTAVGEVRRIDKPEDLDYLAQPTGGEQVYLRICKNGAWSDPIPVTDGKLELYRPAIALGSGGKVWVFYSAHVDADKNLDHGNWELMAAGFDAQGKKAGDAVNVSKSAGSDFMPAAATDSDGHAAVTWVGGRDKNFHVFIAREKDGQFDGPTRLSAPDSNAWEPAIAAGANGQLTVAWDTYAKGDYDVYCATRNTDGGFGEAQPVAASLNFEVRPSLAYDKTGLLWIAYEMSGDQWGKDFGALKKQGIPLYQSGRALGVKTLSPDGNWSIATGVMGAMPGADRAKAAARPVGRQPAGVMGTIAPCFPRIATSDDGSVWLAFRGKPGGNWRVGVGSVWCEYVTRLDAGGWSEAAWIPRSNNILDNRPAVVSTASNGLAVIYSGDGRGEMNPVKVGEPHLQGQVDAETTPEVSVPGDDETPALNASAEEPATQPAQRGGGRRRGRNLEALNQDLFVARFSSSEFQTTNGAIALQKTEPEKPADVVARNDAEKKAIQSMHDYRVNLNGETLRIWRGEFHRHTEFSPDGGNDGGLLDMWRYGIDAAGLDWIGDGDHDYGNGREYSWWTTQKAVTLFTLPGEFVPMFSYERSVSYPEGHRNCIFAQRGVRSLPRLPISDPGVEKPAPDTNLLYMYLKRFNGLCAPHTSATDMGTDWRNHDPEVEPFVEIYQGDRNNYERPDSPRSAVTEAKLKQSTPEKESLGGWRPKGFVNLALLKGHRFAFQSSSDHISTHLSYCNVFVTEPTRQNILEAIRKKRVYGATDNIIADVRCKVGEKEHFMGESFSTPNAPTLRIRLIGPQKFAKVVIIKDDVEVHVATPDASDVSFTWTDPKPTAGKTSYYYVRGEQTPDMEGLTSGELVWASPMWIDYQPK